MTENLVPYMNVLNFIKPFLVQDVSMKLVADENKCIHHRYDVSCKGVTYAKPSFKTVILQRIFKCIFFSKLDTSKRLKNATSM